MDENYNNDLTDIRKTLLGELANMTDQLAGDNLEKFNILLAVSQGTDDLVPLKNALTVALKIEDAQDRASALLALLDEVEVRINFETDQGGADSPANQESGTEKRAPDNEISVDVKNPGE